MKLSNNHELRVKICTPGLWSHFGECTIMLSFCLFVGSILPPCKDSTLTLLNLQKIKQQPMLA